MIDTALYLGYARSLTTAECTLRDTLLAWLPTDIIDAHGHANLAAHVETLPSRVLGHMYSTFPAFSLEESQDLLSEFLPGKHVRSLRFANAFRGIDHAAANGYLLRDSPPQDRVAIYGLPDNIEYTLRMLEHPRTSALKMYAAYTDPPAQTICTAFPPPILAQAEALTIPIVLHLPQKITDSIGDLMQVIAAYPRLRIVLAHLGVTKFVIPGLKEAYQRAATHPLVYMDTSMIPSSDVVRLALETFGDTRILYGSDQPLCYVRSCAYQHPIKGERIISPHPYHWVDRDEFAEFGHLAKDAMLALWLQLDAIRTATTELYGSKSNGSIQRIFSQNAMRVYGFA